ncbi:hypothetical protein ALC57_01838, partial [Trachymyrmex cornetzi]
ISSVSRSILEMATFREPCSPLHQDEEQPDTANATANLLNRLSCTTCDVEIREIFITSLVTVLVIIIQAQANK